MSRWTLPCAMKTNEAGTGHGDGDGGNGDKVWEGHGLHGEIGLDFSGPQGSIGGVGICHALDGIICPMTSGRGKGRLDMEQSGD
jgi:hypothetical protein